jgi:membrane protein required for colicin V production
MTLFDYFVLMVIGVSVLLSVMRGFAREILALAAWVAAFAAANLLSAPVAASLEGLIENDALRLLAAFLAVFFGTLLVMSLLAMAISHALKSAGLGAEDRLLGGFFGFARGMLIVMIFVLLGGLTNLPRQPAWSDAMLSPPLEALATSVKPWLPEVLSRHITYH